MCKHERTPLNKHICLIVYIYSVCVSANVEISLCKSVSQLECANCMDGCGCLGVNVCSCLFMCNCMCVCVCVSRCLMGVKMG